MLAVQYIQIQYYVQSDHHEKSRTKKRENEEENEEKMNPSYGRKNVMRIQVR